ncbi:MAG: T9SS type A sorting domain-containing protein [Cyclobacteriaceae bacterium]
MITRKILGKALLLTFTFCSTLIQAQEHSVARQWNEVLLQGIRNDFARPTVHARNLFHISAAMYDAWAVYDDRANSYFLGQTIDGFTCDFTSVPIPDDIQVAREEAISYAAYRLIRHRFANSPGKDFIAAQADKLLLDLGYNEFITTVDFENDGPAALGNYIAKCVIDFGLQDGANEANGYINKFYFESNPPLSPTLPGNPLLIDPNKWQPLAFSLFIDQAGNPIPGDIPDFLSPEWGVVTPFSLTPDDLTIYDRDGDEYWVYHDPGDPPYLEEDGSGLSAEYQWGFSLVAAWSSHLDPSDGVMIDISPGALGNINTFPSSIESYRDYYDFEEGGDPSEGHSVNPHTGEPYPPNLVPRGDYARVLAEFWADGPDSETPPGHWFTILNFVNDNPDLVKKFKGQGRVLDDLEWDVLSYMILGGTMHDVAISSWGIKGWYDYIRPISAIRYMADQGQSSDPDLPSYSLEGIPLTEGFIELVEVGDPLAGDDDEHVGKIKFKAWKGPDFIDDPETDVAGVDWILAENWWPYQRPTFVTPPFAGYVSGHSTYSRAAADVMTFLTGDNYFPGGVGEFIAPKNEFLVFEEGPSVDVVLQWATYQDASDQTSLSRIWGGIHPPADDIPGRIIGEKIALQSFAKAEGLFGSVVTSIEKNLQPGVSSLKVYPNPVSSNFVTIELMKPGSKSQIEIFDFKGSVVFSKTYTDFNNILRVKLETRSFEPGMYFVKASNGSNAFTQKFLIE